MADLATIESKEITSLDLMDSAAQSCTDWITSRTKKTDEFLIFCGVGNNGGDGLVIARKLNQLGYSVTCVVVHFSTKKSADFSSNYHELKTSEIEIIELHHASDIPDFNGNEIIIDAIFGIGLKQEIVGFTAELIHKINENSNTVISIDIPSGLNPDKKTNSNSAIVKADFTLTFQCPKLAYVLPENNDHVGEFVVLDIGLDQSFIITLDSSYYFVTRIDIQQIYKPRSKFSHKGNFGHAMLLGGSFGKIGAIVLATRAALRSGSGLVTAYVPKCGYEILQTAAPEAMVEVDAEKELNYFNFKTKPTVIGVGPGLGTSEKTSTGFEKFLKENKLPLVLDADALNILARNKALLNFLPKNAILTPHPKEFERLVGPWEDDYHKLELLKAFSAKYNIIVVLKGANTAIAFKHNIYFNNTGNPALATGGSGDVLTGIITALSAQGYQPIEAAIMGVYLHGLTADLAIKDVSVEAFIASTSISYLGQAFQSLI